MVFIQPWLKSGGPLLGGHLASLEVISWPPTLQHILAFPADQQGQGQGQPQQGSAFPRPLLYGTLGLSGQPMPRSRAEASKRSILLQVSLLPVSQFPHLDGSQGKETGS